MLTLRKQNTFFKKAVRLPDGSLALVVFELVEVNGRMVAKAVYGERIESGVPAQESIVALPVFSVSEHIAPIASPFFSYVSALVKDFSFIVSQPSRAPSFA